MLAHISTLGQESYDDGHGPYGAAIKFCLERGADPDAANEADRTTLLHRFSFMGCLNIVQLLISHGANVNISRGDSLTPLLDAVSAHHAEVAQTLIAAGASPAPPDADVAFTCLQACLWNWGGDSPLATALVNMLLEAGADATLANSSGLPPLVQAVGSNMPKAALALVQGGAAHSPSAASAALAKAYVARPPHMPLVQALLDPEGADSPSPPNEPFCTLALAAIKGDTALVQVLLGERGEEVETAWGQRGGKRLLPILEAALPPTHPVLSAAKQEAVRAEWRQLRRVAIWSRRHLRLQRSRVH